MTGKSRLLESRWDDAYTRTLDEPGKLLYRSNLLGADKRITNYGGGNTSAKVLETDPLTGEKVRVMWVKAQWPIPPPARRKPGRAAPCFSCCRLPSASTSTPKKASWECEALTFPNGWTASRQRIFLSAEAEPQCISGGERTVTKSDLAMWTAISAY